MTKINFLKMSGAGNDFVIIDERKIDYHLSAGQITKICQRSHIGCDQLIILKNSKNADILMEIYNSDGSKSGACGNATRCVASLIMNEKNVDKVNIETAAGILQCEKNGDLIAVNMGKPKFDYQQIPISKKIDTDSFFIEEVDLAPYKFSAVNMGNPHIVTFIKEELSDKEFFKIGPILEKHKFFPEKTNVEFAQIIGENHIKVRVWERGAGETLACGSGACAVGVIAIKHKLVQGHEVKTSFKGGDLLIKWQNDDSVIMTGGFEKIFFGTIDEKFIA